MQPALKPQTCQCGLYLDLACAGCARPVCPECSHVEITSLDTRHITVSRFCPACAGNPAKNPWGTLYWENARALYT